ncbi:MAG: hypothetical protein QOI74_1002 [Micromonosporaceae bacterium]|nr:hypothetical protein [Micromonosporaceae bacterium]
MVRADPAAGTRRTVPRWLPPTTTALAVAGLGVAGYLTVEHYTAAATLACPETGVINCQKVTTSAQSAVLGIPVAVLGLVFFAVMVPLCLPLAWRLGRPAVRWGRALFAWAGVGFVFYLLYAELFVLDAICLWCTAVHAITVVLFAVIMFGTTMVDRVDRVDPVDPVDPVDRG